MGEGGDHLAAPDNRQFVEERLGYLPGNGSKRVAIVEQEGRTPMIRAEQIQCFSQRLFPCMV